MEIYLIFKNSAPKIKFNKNYVMARSIDRWNVRSFRRSVLGSLLIFCALIICNNKWMMNILLGPCGPHRHRFDVVVVATTDCYNFIRSESRLCSPFSVCIPSRTLVCSFRVSQVNVVHGIKNYVRFLDVCSLLPHEIEHALCDIRRDRKISTRRELL